MLVDVLAKIKHRQVSHFHNRLSPTILLVNLYLQDI